MITCSSSSKSSTRSSSITLSYDSHVVSFSPFHLMRYSSPVAPARIPTIFSTSTVSSPFFFFSFFSLGALAAAFALAALLGPTAALTSSASLEMSIFTLPFFGAGSSSSSSSSALRLRDGSGSLRIAVFGSSFLDGADLVLMLFM